MWEYIYYLFLLSFIIFLILNKVYKTSMEELPSGDIIMWYTYNKERKFIFLYKHDE